MRNNNIIIIVIAFVALSCGSGKGGKLNNPYDGGHGVGIDTATVHEIERYEDSLRAVESLNDASKTVLPSSSSKHDYEETDNMRGFDPASEDDIKDYID